MDERVCVSKLEEGQQTDGIDRDERLEIRMGERTGE